MKVIITGGAGFLGGQLAAALLNRKILMTPQGLQEIENIILQDIAEPQIEVAGLDERCRYVVGDIADRQFVEGMIGCDEVHLFHLASIVSAAGEQDFDLAMRINLDGIRNVLEACRATNGLSRLVFASSLAVFGGEAMPLTVSDTTKQTPQSTYGVTKSIGELLINDYARKNFVDGRTARLPTIIIRPGKPNAAASSFCSAIFREPLNGEEAFLPVSQEFRTPVTGLRAIIEGMIQLMELDGATLGGDRAINMPGLSVTAAEMIAAVKRAGTRYDRKIGTIAPRLDPRIAAIVETWPAAMEAERALALGIKPSASLDAIIDDYLVDFMS